MVSERWEKKTGEPYNYSTLKVTRGGTQGGEAREAPETCRVKETQPGAGESKVATVHGTKGHREQVHRAPHLAECRSAHVCKDISNRKRSENSPNTWKLNNIRQNNLGVK